MRNVYVAIFFIENTSTFWQKVFSMQVSNLGYQVWAIATYQLTTNLKSVSGMKLSRDMDVTQKPVWH